MAEFGEHLEIDVEDHGLAEAAAEARELAQALQSARDAGAELGGTDFAPDAELAAAAEAASSLRDSLIEASGAADTLAASLAAVDDELGTADLEQGAQDAGEAFGALGTAMDKLPISPMGVAIGALVVGAAAAAPAVVALGLGFTSFAVLAAPALDKVKNGYEEITKARAKLNAATTSSAAAADAKALAKDWSNFSPGIAGAVRGVLSFEAAWKKLGRTSGIQKAAFGDITKTLGIAKDLLPDVAKLAQAAAPAIGKMLDAIGKGVKSKGFQDFVKSMATEIGPASKALTRLGGAILGFTGSTLEKLKPISVPFINSLSHLTKAITPGVGTLLKNAATGLTSIVNVSAAHVGDLTTVARDLGKVSTLQFKNLSSIGGAFKTLAGDLGPLANVLGLVNKFASGGSFIDKLVRGSFGKALDTVVPGLGAVSQVEKIAGEINKQAASQKPVSIPVKANTSQFTASLSGATKGMPPVKFPVKADTASFSSSVNSAAKSIPPAKIKITVSGTAQVTAAFASIVTAAAALPAKVEAAMSGLAGAMRSIGVSAADGLAAGIEAGTGAAVAAASAMAAAVTAAAHVSLGIHSPSKVFEKIGADTVKGFVLGLEGGKSQVAAAMALITGHKAFTDSTITETVKKLTEKVTKAYKDKQISKGEDSQLTGFIRSDNRRLMALAKQRADIEKEIKAADALAKSVASSARQGGSIATLQGAMPAGSVSAAGLEQGMTTQLAAIKKFRTELKQLKKEGASKSVLRQVAAEGVTQGGAAAQALLAGGKGAIAKISQLQHQIAQAAKGLGKTAANASYESGSQIGKGLAAGLKGELKGVVAAMKDLAKKLVDEIKKALKIHSPSGVMIEVGAAIPAGLAIGITGGTPKAVGAMHGLSGAVTGASPHGYGGGGHGGGTPPIIIHNHIHLDGRQVAQSVQSSSLQRGRRNVAVGLKPANRGA